MASYSSHRLIMGKEEIDNFFLSHWGYFELKGKFRKIFRILLRNRMEDEAETWHTYIGHCPLQKLCFLFQSNKNSGCYCNLVSIDL